MYLLKYIPPYLKQIHTTHHQKNPIPHMTVVLCYSVNNKHNHIIKYNVIKWWYIVRTSTTQKSEESHISFLGVVSSVRLSTMLRQISSQTSQLSGIWCVHNELKQEELVLHPGLDLVNMVIRPLQFTKSRFTKSLNSTFFLILAHHSLGDISAPFQCLIRKHQEIIT